MQFFKKPDGTVWAFESDGSQDELITEHGDLTPMTPEEVQAHLSPPALPAPARQLTSLEYLDLFTEAEQLAVATVAMQSPTVKLWYDRMLAAQFITNDDPRTEAGLAALVAVGLLTGERKDKILAAM